MAYRFNIFTGQLDLVNTSGGGGGGTLTGVIPTNSIDFSVSGTDVTGDVKLSAAPADSNNSLVSLSIQTDGIKAEIPNSEIQSAALNLQGPNTLLDNNSGTVLTYSSSAYSFTFIDYSLFRNGNYRTGRILLANSLSNASIADAGYVELGTCGLVFGVSVSAGLVNLNYTTTSTGV